MRAPFLLTIVLISTALAGCAKASGDPLEAPVGTNNVEATGEALQDAGSIEGVVVDDTLLPIPGASVALEGVEGVATTDETGAFSFTNLAPGTYTINAARLGFTSVAKRIDVLAGAPMPVQLILQEIRVVAARVESIENRMFMACGGGLIGVTFTGGCPAQLFPNHDVTADHNVTGPAVELRSVIAELIWQQTSGLSSRALRLTGGINESGGNLPSFEERYYNVEGPSPVYARADADDGEPLDGLDETNERYFIRHRIWVPFQSAEAPFAILVLEQPMTVWSSFFYGEPAPEGFSALPDV